MADGYGRFRVSGRKVPAHRFSYELQHGPIPAKLVIDHRCHNEDPACPGGGDCLHRRCMNPAHLEAVTFKENIRRGSGIAGRYAQRTHCSRGHSFEPPNGFINSQGSRGCHACNRFRAQRARQAARERVMHSGG